MASGRYIALAGALCAFVIFGVDVGGDFGSFVPMCYAAVICLVFASGSSGLIWIGASTCSILTLAGMDMDPEGDWYGELAGRIVTIAALFGTSYVFAKASLMMRLQERDLATAKASLRQFAEKRTNELRRSRAIANIMNDLRIEREKLRCALHDVNTLRGYIPICSCCKKIRDDKGYWEEVEEYVRRHSMAEFSHGLCPECYEQQLKEFRNESEESEPG